MPEDPPRRRGPVRRALGRVVDVLDALEALALLWRGVVLVLRVVTAPFRWLTSLVD